MPHDNLAFLPVFCVCSQKPKTTILMDKTKGMWSSKSCKREKEPHILHNRVLLHLPNVFPLKIFAVLVEDTFHITFYSDVHQLLFQIFSSRVKNGVFNSPQKNLTIAVTFKFDTKKWQHLTVLLQHNRVQRVEHRQQILFNLHFVRTRRWKSSLHSYKKMQIAKRLVYLHC